LNIPIAKEAWSKVIILGMSAMLLFALSSFITIFPSVILLLLIGFILFFFRDPKRVMPLQKNAIVSPADGKVVEISDVYDKKFMGGRCKKIGIFLSIFNVHVNYAPAEGEVIYTAYQAGKFTNAAKSKAPLINENNSIGIETNNIKIMVRQIAGLIAKRIVCKCQEGDSLKKGEKIGLIQFGSRVEIYLPSHIQLCVREGDKVKAKKNIIGITVP
jgi:phosphatidylserine decarboxylase